MATKTDWVTKKNGFKYADFLVSSQYPHLINNHALTIPQRNIIKLMVQSVLDPLVMSFDGKILITSGFRTVELNERVKGSPNSDHMRCCAADLFPQNGKSELLYDIIRNTLPYRQVIHYPKKKFVHVSINIPGIDYKHESFIL